MIQNLVCAMKMHHPNGNPMKLDLLAMKEKMGDKAELETEGPRAFPACRVRPSDYSKSVVLVYLSGAVVFTGAQNREEAHANHRVAYEICRKFPLSVADCNIPKYMMHARKRKRLTSDEGLKTLDVRLKKTRPTRLLDLKSQEGVPMGLDFDLVMSSEDLETIQKTAREFNLEEDFQKNLGFMKIQDTEQKEKSLIPYKPSLSKLKNFSSFP
jgi:hypothetical protein